MSASTLIRGNRPDGFLPLSTSITERIASPKAGGSVAKQENPAESATQRRINGR